MTTSNAMQAVMRSLIELREEHPILDEIQFLAFRPTAEGMTALAFSTSRGESAIQLKAAVDKHLGLEK